MRKGTGRRGKGSSIYQGHRPYTPSAGAVSHSSRNLKPKEVLSCAEANHGMTINTGAGKQNALKICTTSA
eukprot:1159348-Pelagomonas_calceolata.AAC.3